MKSNREQIVKALECCIVQHTECRKCPLLYTACESGACYKQSKIDALALIKELTEENSNLDDTIACLKIELETVKADTGRKMQKRLEERIDQIIQVFDFQISECNAIRQVLRGVKNDIYQVAEELLEENNV